MAAHLKKIEDLESTIKDLIDKGEELQLLVAQGFSWLDEQTEEFKLSDEGLDRLNYLNRASNMVDKITNFEKLTFNSESGKGI